MILSLKIYYFFKDVYPNFYAMSCLGDMEIYEDNVDNFIDDVILKILEYRK